MVERTESAFIDLSNCDREPIHLLGRIQPHGALMVFSPDWMLIGASENLSEFAGAYDVPLQGDSADDFVCPPAMQQLRDVAMLLTDPDQIEKLFGIALFSEQRLFDVAVHVNCDLYYVELEPHAKDEGQIHMLRAAIASLSRQRTIEDLAKVASASLAKLTGFDRVMVYRFKDDNSGSVIAEELSPGVEGFLGMRFPASDIPVQARALYKRSLTRLISDVNYEGVPVLPTDTDLTLVGLRAVSPIHMEYLRNMGVSASFSVSLIVNKELWGLIACHHLEPKVVSLATRAFVELFAETLSLELSSRIDREELFENTLFKQFGLQMTASISPERSLFDNLKLFAPKIKELIDCDALVIRIDSKTLCVGEDLSSEDIEILVRRANSMPSTEIFSTDSIQQWLGSSVTVGERWGGVLVVPISRTPRDLLIFLRKEVAKTVTWGGNPEKPVSFGPNGSRLTPRKSFEAWKELKRGFSDPWTASETLVAERLKGLLLEVMVRLIDKHQRNQRAVESKQELLIDELNHRARYMLELVNGILLQSRSGPEISSEKFKQVVLGRLQALTLAQNLLTENKWAALDISEVISIEFESFLHDPSKVKISGSAVLLKPKAFTTLSLLIHELISNSINSGALSEPSGEVKIEWRQNSRSDLEMSWVEAAPNCPFVARRDEFSGLIIERAIPFELGGEAEISSEDGCLTASYLIPAKFVEYRDKNQSPNRVVESARPEPPEGAEASKRRVAVPRGSFLVLSESMIGTNQYEALLRRLGAGEVVLHRSASEALQSIQNRTFNLVLFELTFDSETLQKIRLELDQRDIPYVVIAGYTSSMSGSEVYPESRVLKKPFNEGKFAKTILDALGVSSGR